MTAKVIWVEAGIAALIILALIVVLVGQMKRRDWERLKTERLNLLRDLIEPVGVVFDKPDVRNEGRNLIRSIVLRNQAGQKLGKIGISSKSPDVYFINSSGERKTAESDDDLIRIVHLVRAEYEIALSPSDFEKLFEDNP